MTHKSILDYTNLRANFKSRFTLDLCPCTIRCPWNIKMIELILHVWEVIQVTMMNLTYHPERRVMSLTDFRIPGNLIIELI